MMMAVRPWMTAWRIDRAVRHRPAECEHDRDLLRIPEKINPLRFGPPELGFDDNRDRPGEPFRPLALPRPGGRGAQREKHDKAEDRKQNGVAHAREASNQS